MEFPTLGKHCSVKECKQLDFLPFTCVQCKKVFCLYHKDFSAHKCEYQYSRVAPECPICHQILTIPSGADPNQVMNQHIDAGCPKIQKQSINYPCSYKGCKNNELVQILCDKCKHQFCVYHRYSDNHLCSASNTDVAQKETKDHGSWRQNIQERITKYLKSSNPTAKTVNLMRMKNKALGNTKIPVEQRFYLEVIYPIDSKVEPKMMFFDRDNSIGKVLDLVADAGNVKNENNKPDAPKLHLISLKSGEPIPNSSLLKDLGATLQSGDPILLERI